MKLFIKNKGRFTRLFHYRRTGTSDCIHDRKVEVVGGSIKSSFFGNSFKIRKRTSSEKGISYIRNTTVSNFHYHFQIYSQHNLY